MNCNTVTCCIKSSGPDIQSLWMLRSNDLLHIRNISGDSSLSGQSWLRAHSMAELAAGTLSALIFIMKIVHEVQETKKSAKKCKVLVCAQANNELFNVTESKVI